MSERSGAIKNFRWSYGGGVLSILWDDREAVVFIGSVAKTASDALFKFCEGIKDGDKECAELIEVFLSGLIIGARAARSGNVVFRTGNTDETQS